MITSVNCFPKAIQILAREDQYEVVAQKLPHNGLAEDGTMKGYSVEEMIEVCWKLGYTLWIFPVEWAPVALVALKRMDAALVCGTLRDGREHAIVYLKGMYLDSTHVYGRESPFEKITILGKLEKWST